MTRYLLDTHTVLWWAEDSPRLSPAHRAILGNPSLEVYLSVVSVWETAIKASQGRLDLPCEPGPFYQQVVDRGNFKVLPIQVSHAAAVYSLPRLHADPFDRLLICQARHEGLTLLSNDGVFRQYDLPGLIG